MSRTTRASSSLMPALSRALSRFASWWAGELKALLPPGMLRWWRESADGVVMLIFDGARATFGRIVAGHCEEIHSIESGTGTQSSQSAEVKNRLVRAAGRHYKLVVGVPAQNILRRTITLPLAVEENLRQALSFELDRYTPFKPEQIYFDFRVIERDAPRKRLSVELAAVTKSVVDQAIARATALGLSVDAASPSDELLRQAEHCHDFLPAGARARRPTGRLWLRAGMAGLTVALLAVFLAVPIWQKRSTAIALLEPLAQASAAAREVDALRDRLQKSADTYNFLHNKKWETQPTLQVLEEVSALLPDDTFLMQLDYDSKGVQLQGETASPTMLLQTLEASPMFKDAGFKSQLVKIQGTTNDRFHVSVALEAPVKSQTLEQPVARPAVAKEAGKS